MEKYTNYKLELDRCDQMNTLYNTTKIKTWNILMCLPSWALSPPGMVAVILAHLIGYCCLLLSII